jgi:hypothetical protein
VKRKWKEAAERVVTYIFDERVCRATGKAQAQIGWEMDLADGVRAVFILSRRSNCPRLAQLFRAQSCKPIRVYKGPGEPFPIISSPPSNSPVHFTPISKHEGKIIQFSHLKKIISYNLKLNHIINTFPFFFSSTNNSSSFWPLWSPQLLLLRFTPNLPTQPRLLLVTPNPPRNT